MRRDPRGRGGGPVRAELLARRRRLVASYARPDVEEWERVDAAARWLVPELEAGEPLTLRAAEVRDWLPGGAGAGHLRDRWFRLEADDSLTEVERVPGTGDRLGNPVRWRPVGGG